MSVDNVACNKTLASHHPVLFDRWKEPTCSSASCDLDGRDEQAFVFSNSLYLFLIFALKSVSEFNSNTVLLLKALSVALDTIFCSKKLVSLSITFPGPLSATPFPTSALGPHCTARRIISALKRDRLGNRSSWEAINQPKLKVAQGQGLQASGSTYRRQNRAALQSGTPTGTPCLSFCRASAAPQPWKSLHCLIGI